MTKQKEQIVIDVNGLKTIQDYFYVGMAREIPPLLSHAGGVQINIGPGKYKVLKNTYSLDFPEFDANKDKMPVDDNSVSVIHAYHLFEHLTNPIHLLAECQRVLKIGGYINIVVPYYTSNLFHKCIDHKMSYTEGTFDNLFNDYAFDPSYGKVKRWKLKVHTSFGIFVEEKNTALFTQLVKIS